MKDFFVQFFNKYKVALIAGVLALGIGSAGWAGFKIFDQRQNKIAEEEVYQYRYLLAQAEKKHEGQVLDSSRSFFSVKKAKDPSLFEKEIKQYKNFLMSAEKPRPAHLLAVIELADFLTQYNKETSAVELLNSVHLKSRKKGWLAGALALKLGSLFLNQKNYTRAVHLFSLVLEDKKAMPFHLEALFKTALCREEMGEYNQAQEIYQAITQNEKAGLYKTKAENFLRLLKVKQKLKGS